MAGNTPQLVEPRAANPFSAGEISVNARAQPGGMVAIESQRAIAEVQAMMIIARTNPRDPIRAMERILNACTRPTLADAALYQFARGGTDIRGPSIRLAEAIAQQWGNIYSGIKEISRHDGYSECVAFAWDLETGYRDDRQFQIRHWRDTNKGGYQLETERDIYELIANFGQRRKRAVLLTVIPGDVQEAAVEQCERTMAASADVTPEGIKKLMAAFDELGVTGPQLEARIQRRLDAIRPAQVVMLRKIFQSLKDGMSAPADWFDAVPLVETLADEKPADQKPPADEPRRARGRPRRAAAAEPSDGDKPPGNPSPGTEGGSPPATSQPAQSTSPPKVQFEV